MNKKILIIIGAIIIIIFGSISFFYFKKELKLKNTEKNIEENIDPNLFSDFDACSEQEEVIISGVIENVGSEIIYIKTNDDKRVEILIHPSTLFIEQIVDGEEIIGNNEIELSGFGLNDSVVAVSVLQENEMYLGMVIKKLIFK